MGTRNIRKSIKKFDACLAKEIGENLAKWMGKNNILPATLAKKIGVSKAAISLFLKGSRIPSGEVLRKLNEHTKISIGWLIGGSDWEFMDKSEGEVLRQIRNLRADPSMAHLMQYLFGHPEHKILCNKLMDAHASLDDLKKALGDFLVARAKEDKDALMGNPKTEFPPLRERERERVNKAKEG